MKRNYWTEHREQKDFLVKWFPHWGRKILARELKLSEATVRNKTNKLKLTLLPKSERLCYSCHKEFQTSRRNGVYCPACYKVRRAAVRRCHISADPLMGRLKETLRTLTYRAQRWNIKTDIDISFLLNLWNKQEGLCFYTKVPMVATNIVGRGRDPNALSVDRIDSSKPYIKSNIVLCSWWANSAKGELTPAEFQSRCGMVYNNSKSTCP